MSTWLPLATHGDSEEQVRQAILDYAAAKASELRIQMRADGWPLDVIEIALAKFDEMQREQIERDVPIIMRNMAISAGAASLN